MTAAATGPAATARELIDAVSTGFRELPRHDSSGGPDGPIGWSGYDASRARARERTGETEAVVCGTADAGGTEAVLVAFEFGFLGGSIGAGTGERIETAFITARELSLPVVSLIASGGSRMQEGMFALTQLQRIARQMVRLRAAGLPHVAVLAGPVTGGGWATLGAGADVRVALPGAQVGFAGSRVRPAGADPRAYTAEGQFAAGRVDRIVEPGELRATVARWLSLLTRPAPGPVPPPRALRAADPPRGGWEAVLRAREPDRPRARAYLEAYFTEREPLGGTDPGILSGFGLHEGRSVAYVAQCGTATTPAGFRAAIRLVGLADRLGIPVLTLVDTPGAANDAEAEREGVGPAIAEAITTLAGCRIPVTTLLIGEGGSGGAIALTSLGRTWVTPDSYYSVVAPELAVSILKRGPEQVPATAEQLRLRPQDLVDLGVARGIVSP
ncbi:carboxyl transferase domain-containing protein [Streptomyces sp. DSM 44917]|uniref:Acetyl-coenzyme A carboxylase carboxyl transferase subunits beta/alpha n=1 Tax=Streptomyces boetiae TaxID=3075541 RepID=A0ABU2LB59_9ACTN|nr:carboxyl transferase domain-containing protein [Streptomyces sp. DSM 44917]MDT0308711.1 carboxyl transferase domain-containing protein [Streptomyces sp. DSM 44917]